MVAGTQEVLGLSGSFVAFVMVGGVLMAITTIYGFRALARLAVVAVPILALILGTVVIMAVRRYGIVAAPDPAPRSEEHKSELQSLMRLSSAVFCLTTTSA